MPPNLAAALHPPTDAPQLTLAGGAVRTTPDEMIVLKSRQSTWDPHAPFIVARAAPDIISQHSDIYTPRFVTFLAAYIHEFLQQAANVDPGSADAPCSAVTGSNSVITEPKSSKPLTGEKPGDRICERAVAGALCTAQAR